MNMILLYLSSAADECAVTANLYYHQIHLTGELGHVFFTLGTKMAEIPLFKHRVSRFLFLTMHILKPAALVLS